MTDPRTLPELSSFSHEGIRCARPDPRIRSGRAQASGAGSSHGRANQPDSLAWLSEFDVFTDEDSFRGDDALADPDGTLRRMIATKSLEKASSETRLILAKRLASLEATPKAPEAPRAVIRMVGYRVRSAPAYHERLRFLHAERRMRWIADSRVECVVGVALDGFIPAEHASTRIDRAGDGAASRIAASLRQFLRDMPEGTVGELGEHIIETSAAPAAGTAETEWTALAVHGVTIPTSSLAAVRAHLVDAMLRGVAFRQDAMRHAPLQAHIRREGFTFGGASAVQGAGAANDVASAFARSAEGHGDALALLHPDLRAVVEAAGEPDGRLILGESIADPAGLANRTRKLEGRTDG